MKTNCWLVLGTMLATSAVAQVDTNNLPGIPAPANVAAPATPESAPVVAPAPARIKAAPKKRALKKIHEPAVALVAGPATVTVENLNLRGQAGLKGEAVGRLKKGDTVTVLSQINLDKHAANEPAQWAKILLPSDIKVWVSSRYVDAATKTVTARKLNLRAGPGENYSVLGVIEKGTTVNELSEKGGWTQVEAPGTAFAFVAAMYLNQEAPATVAATTPVPAAVETPAVVPAPENNNVAVAQPAAVQLAPAPTPTPAPGTTENPASATTAPATSPTSTVAGGGAGEVAPLVVDTNPPPPRVVSHEGYVRHTVSLVAPTPYELFDWDTGNAINYLYSPTPNLDLSRYDGYKIIATGQEGISARWPNTPVLTIQKIYVMATTYPEVSKRLSSPRASQKNISGTQPLQRR